MKKIFKIILVGLSVAVIAPSCSIEKRVYNSGYHITWNSLKSNAKSTEATEAANTAKNDAIQNSSKLHTIAAPSTIEKFSAATENKATTKTAEKLIQNETKSTASAAPVASKKVLAKTQNVKALAKTVAVKQAVKNTPANNSDDELILLYLLAILIPFVAVGIVTDWDLADVFINLLLTFLCYIPGVIHAFIKIRDNR